MCVYVYIGDNENTKTVVIISVFSPLYKSGKDYILHKHEIYNRRGGTSAVTAGANFQLPIIVIDLP